MQKGTRFIKYYGLALFILFIGCLYTIYISLYIEDYPKEHYYFVIPMSAWYLLTAIGLLIRKQWGYYLFKFFLYVLFLAFPIGTIVSYKSLTYIKRNDIKDLFSNNYGTRRA
jgi:hypothetical protein